MSATLPCLAPHRALSRRTTEQTFSSFLQNVGHFILRVRILHHLTPLPLDVPIAGVCGVYRGGGAERGGAWELPCRRLYCLWGEALTLGRGQVSEWRKLR
ncbi:hypothetical protein E2C01_086930 [Portunus trituberculatus]|uniref:Uncharacterized protein n=1 Tax=Portunus trituberculatus TaxID=210409 RepID=A0A5B7JAM7_PORTR|nr:hypothetical protein [Portunus trituberculatus]